MGLDEPPHDEEPETRAWHFVAQDRAAAERFEDHRRVGLAHPDAFVVDHEHHVPAARLDAQFDLPAGRRVLDGVAHELERICSMRMRSHDIAISSGSSSSTVCFAELVA